jgi:hypothetical protein
MLVKVTACARAEPNDDNNTMQVASAASPIGRNLPADARDLPQRARNPNPDIWPQLRGRLFQWHFSMMSGPNLDGI